MRRITLSALIVAIAVTLVACSKPTDSTEESAMKLPNPAARYCEEQGGSYDLGTGNCTLEDGSVVDAWDHFRQAHQAQQVGLPNPAAVFCEERGSYNLETGECTLEDGSVVDGWTYYRENHRD